MPALSISTDDSLRDQRRETKDGRQRQLQLINDDDRIDFSLDEAIAPDDLLQHHRRQTFVPNRVPVPTEQKNKEEIFCDQSDAGSEKLPPYIAARPATTISRPTSAATRQQPHQTSPKFYPDLVPEQQSEMDLERGDRKPDDPREPAPNPLGQRMRQLQQKFPMVFWCLQKGKNGFNKLGSYKWTLVVGLLLLICMPPITDRALAFYGFGNDGPIKGSYATDWQSDINKKLNAHIKPKSEEEKAARKEAWRTFSMFQKWGKDGFPFRYNFLIWLVLMVIIVVTQFLCLRRKDKKQGARVKIRNLVYKLKRMRRPKNPNSDVRELAEHQNNINFTGPNTPEHAVTPPPSAPPIEQIEEQRPELLTIKSNIYPSLNDKNREEESLFDCRRPLLHDFNSVRLEMIDQEASDNLYEIELRRAPRPPSTITELSDRGDAIVDEQRHEQEGQKEEPTTKIEQQKEEQTKIALSVEEV